MSYRIKTEPDRIRLSLFDHVTRADMVAGMAEMEAIERTLGRVPDRIADLSGLTNSDLDYRLILHVADDRRERKFPNTFRTAIVAPTQVTYGFARMFQTLMDNPMIEVRIFESVADAEAWLDTAP